MIDLKTEKNKIKNKIKNDNILKALKGEKVDRVPLWIMRQAGRYLPEYREIRKTVPDFMGLCQNPKLACEVTLQPLRRFDLDASIMFSDILVIPHAMGMDLEFIPGKGPVFHDPIKNLKDIDNLKLINSNQDLSYVMETIDLIKTGLNNSVPLIGFSGSPWTLATYMIEGSGSKQFSIVKKMVYENPELITKLLDKLSDSIIDYFMAQINAGVNLLMLFDTWGGILDLPRYKEFSLRFMDKIICKVREKVREQNIENNGDSKSDSNSDGREIPIIIFTKGGGLYLSEQESISPDGIGLDWTMDIGDARKIVDSKISLQGNIDPCVLFSDKSKISKEVDNLFEKLSGNFDSRFIFNLGHGILPQIDPDKVQHLIECVHNH